MSILKDINKKIIDHTSITQLDEKKDEILELVKNGTKFYKVMCPQIFKEINSNSGNHMTITKNYIMLNYEKPKKKEDRESIIEDVMNKLAVFFIKNNIMSIDQPIQIKMSDLGQIVIISIGKTPIMVQDIGITADQLVTLVLEIKDEQTANIKDDNGLIVFNIIK